MEAAKKSETPFFSEFTKIIFGILIGLASFQVLAPLIWNYLSDLLHLEKLTSFKWIVAIYFLMPSLVLSIWWHISGNKKLTDLFKKCLLNQDGQVILTKILSITFPALSIIYAFLFLLPQIFDNKFLFYGLQVISTLTSAIVLMICRKMTFDNLKKAEAISEVKKEEIKYRVFTSIIICLFLFFAGFEFLYLSHIDKTKAVDRVEFDAVKIQNKQVIQNAFRLNDLKDGVASTRKKFENNEERLLLSYKLSLLKKMHSDTTGLKANTNEMANLIEPVIDYKKLLSKSRLENKDTTLNNQYLYMGKQIGALLKFVDMATDCTAASSSSFELKPPPYKIDSVLNYSTYDYNRNSTIKLMEKEFNWYETAIPVLKMIEMKLGQLSKRQLTLVLSNVQMKGIFLISTLFILMGSLFLFLKVNKDLLSKQFQNSSAQSSTLVECISTNEKLYSTIWIFLNVGIWLLIPLFKPVNESNINIDKPLQMLTFAPEYGNDVKEYKYDQSQNNFNDNSLSITLMKEDTLRKVLPGWSDSINKYSASDEAKINEILRRVRKMNNDEDEAVILAKLYFAMQAPNSHGVNDSTFKNRRKK